MPIRNKIVLHFTFLTAVILLLFGYFIYLFTQKHTERQFFQRMVVRAGVAGKAKFEADSNNLNFYNEIRDDHLQRLPDEKEYFFGSVKEASHVLPDAVANTIARELSPGKIVETREGDLQYTAIIYNYKGNKRR